MKIKNIHIFGGGTVAHITNHFAVCAPAYGSTAHAIFDKVKFDSRFENSNVKFELTKMAGGALETNEDISNRIEELKKDYNTKIIFFNCALVDYKPFEIYDAEGNLKTAITGKYAGRQDTRANPYIEVSFVRAKKIISKIREGRKDIFLVGFKTTCGASKQEMYEKGLRLCKEGSVNLVLVNDTKTRWNMIICPEECVYCETQNREEVLKELIDMVWYRSQLTFVASTVVEGKPVSWSDERIPNSLRCVVDYAIKGQAYKPFYGKTAGHFAVKLSDTEFLTSIRKSDFNKLSENGLVYIRTDKPDSVIAYGAKPSVGGQSQRIVFKNHPGYECIFHAHIPLKENHSDDIPIVSQREFECGSIECGINCSNGLKEFGPLKAVMLNNHGPNILFPKDIDPQVVINFIDRNFNLSEKTGGYNLI